MRYRLRYLDLDNKMCHHLSLPVLEQVYPQTVICEHLSQHQSWERRERRLNMLSLIYVLLAAALWTRLALPRVLERLGRPLHLVGLPWQELRVSASAISSRREQLGRSVLSSLFAHCCRPVCTKETPGAYRFGRRLVALDGTVQDVADTQANASAFARPSNQYGPGPFPQIRLLLLTECGSHASIGAVVDTSQQAEVSLAYDLLERIEPDMLVLHDAQFSGRDLWQAIRGRRAHVLGMLPSHHLSTYLRHLSDGSYLACSPKSRERERAAERPVLVRVIEYRISDARLADPGQVYRLATTLLNPRTAPALDLIACYHERWEVEVCLDEIKTPQRLQHPVLRSRTPEGVRQEVYALLLTHYAVRALMHQAACEADLDPDRLSFTDAIFVLEETARELALVCPTQQESLQEQMLSRLQASVLPPRRLRINPRVLKKLYRKYKPKSSAPPPLPPFAPEDRFLDFVVLLI